LQTQFKASEEIITQPGEEIKDSSLIFSREGPSDEDEKKKKKKDKNNKKDAEDENDLQDERGLKTTSLGEAIMIWQDKFSRLIVFFSFYIFTVFFLAR
jgi:hypothetical protein